MQLHRKWIGSPSVGIIPLISFQAKADVAAETPNRVRRGHSKSPSSDQLVRRKDLWPLPLEGERETNHFALSKTERGAPVSWGMRRVERSWCWPQRITSYRCRARWNHCVWTGSTRACFFVRTRTTWTSRLETADKASGGIYIAWESNDAPKQNSAQGCTSGATCTWFVQNYGRRCRLLKYAHSATSCKIMLYSILEHQLSCARFRSVPSLLQCASRIISK